MSATVIVSANSASRSPVWPRFFCGLSSSRNPGCEEPDSQATSKTASCQASEMSVRPPEEAAEYRCPRTNGVRSSASRASVSFGYRQPARISRYRSLRSEEHTSELQSRLHLVCRLLLEKKKKIDRGSICIS